MVLRSLVDEKEIIIKKGETEGGCLMATGKCIIIGLFDLNKNKEKGPGDCNKSVGRIADSLAAAGY